MPPEDREILEVKYAAPPFCKLSERELLQAAEILILKLAVITGWAVPKDELYKILLEQFILKIKESYSNVNAAEFEYAFRKYKVQEYGKAINLHTIDDVMEQYLAQRLEISKMEETKAHRELPGASVNTDEFIEACFQTWKRLGKSSIPEMCYDELFSTNGKTYSVYDLAGKKKIVDEYFKKYDEHLQQRNTKTL